jgi:hypothetical protein
LTTALPPRAALPSTSTTDAVEQNAHPLHSAVLHGDLEAIARLVQQKDAQGHRWLSTLNADRQSPLDLVNTLPFPDAKKEEIRSALLKSHNPSAPQGYTKPSAFHGTPWGVEILKSGELLPGVNDPKGGALSLEKQVFFSDRTPASDTDSTTRPHLRTKARSYAEGKAIDENGAANRLAQHALAKSLLTKADSSAQQSTPTSSAEPSVAAGDDIGHAVKAHVASEIAEKTYPKIFETKGQPNKRMLEAISARTQFPQELQIERADGGHEVVGGEKLQQAYRQALQDIVNERETGKAPLLGLLNEGVVVPVVFGFERLEGLSSHPIDEVEYSYQSEPHPLAGAENGGKLKEIEVQNLSDLATLVLGALVKEAQFPEDVMIRVKARGKNAAQAQFLTPEQLNAFKAQVERRIHALPGDTSLADRPLEELQTLNRTLREQPAELERWAQPEGKPATSETR